jgi:hypothetical protein
MMNHSNPYMDPRMDPQYYMRFNHHHQQPPPPQPGGYGLPAKKEGDDQEVAMNLLQLKSNPENGEASDAELRMHAQRHAPMMRGHHGLYPPMGNMYGYPTAGFDRPMFHPHGHAPPLMEEPAMLVDVDDLIRDSTLVVQKDRDLIPDALLVAMAQMKPCKLIQADRVGCYKAREIGFIGMCCKHCGGQPGFGRYFPNSVRSLAQTTTSQTILKHIGGKCRFCPPNIRKAVMDLQRLQAQKEGVASARPRYGSRKIFFQRMWARLHGTDHVVDEQDDEVSSTNANDLALDKSEEKPLASATVAEEQDEDFGSSSDTPESRDADTEGINGEAGTSPKKRKARDEDGDDQSE